MQQRCYKIYVYRHRITLKNYPVIEEVSIVFASTSNGESVSIGETEMHITSRLLTIIKEDHMTKKKLEPIHPGEILMEEFLKPMGISQYKLAKDISVPARRINEIVQGKRAVTPDTALRLSRYFGLSERFWINLQARYDLEIEKDRLSTRLDKEVHVYAAAG